MRSCHSLLPTLESSIALGIKSNLLDMALRPAVFVHGYPWDLVSVFFFAFFTFCHLSRPSFLISTIVLPLSSMFFLFLCLMSAHHTVNNTKKSHRVAYVLSELLI